MGNSSQNIEYLISLGLFELPGKISTDKRSFKKIEDDYEVNRKAKGIAMDLVLKTIDKKRIVVKRNSEGCQADIYYAQNDLDERFCMPIKVKATMHKNLDTNSYDFDMRGEMFSGMVICHAVEDALWWVFHLNEKCLRGILTIPYDGREGTSLDSNEIRDLFGRIRA